MVWRQLPDGSFWDTDTGDLRGLDGDREEGARLRSAAATGIPVRRRAVNPIPPLPSQKLVELPSTAGPEVIIDPKRDVLALNPFELGVGMFSAETGKRVLVVAGILGAAFVACKLSGK
jgi:hypothetical protein